MASIIEIIAKFLGDEAKAKIKGLGDEVGGLGDKSKETDKSNEKLGVGLGDLAGKLGITLSAAGLAAGAFALLKQSVDAYGESELVGAQINAVLQSTQGIAGMTAEEIDNLANSLSRMSGVDDEAIKRGEALLLTFTKVGKDVFPQATESALNMSMAMGTDLQSAIMQVGKALNEPVQGLTALNRAGVQFTDEQEKQIKAMVEMNDIAGAQAIILDELETQFGSVAEMMGDTTVGSANKLKVAWGNLLETMGEGSAGVWRGVTEGLTSIVESTDEAMQASNSHFDAIRQGNALMLEYGGNVALTRSEVQMYGERVEQAGYEYARAEQYGLAWEKMLQSSTETTYAANDALSEYVPNFSKLLDMSTSIADETERYNQKQTDLQTKQAEIKTQIDELISQGWSPYGEKIMGLQSDYDALSAKSEEMALRHSQAMGKMQYDLLVTKLSADGLTDAEYQIAQQAGLMFGVFDQQSVESARNMDLVTQAVSEGKLKVQDMQKALDLLPKLKDINVVIHAIAQIPGAVGGSNPQAQQGGYGYQGYNNSNGYAAGGIATGPDTGHWELLHGAEAVIPLQGGAVPVQISGAGGGGSVQVTLNINSPINLMTEQEAQSVLIPYVVQGIKQAQAEGRL